MFYIKHESNFKQFTSQVYELVMIEVKDNGNYQIIPL